MSKHGAYFPITKSSKRYIYIGVRRVTVPSKMNEYLEDACTACENNSIKVVSKFRCKCMTCGFPFTIFWE